MDVFCFSTYIALPFDRSSCFLFFFYSLYYFGDGLVEEKGTSPCSIIV